MKTKTIMFDVDGVLADFVYAFTKEAGVTPWSHTDQLAWQFPEEVIPAEVRAATWQKVLTTFYWWARLPSLVPQETFDQINKIRDENCVVFATHRDGNPTAQRQTAYWLIDKGIQAPSVILTKYKGEAAKVIGADYAIDDKPENVALIKWITDDLARPCKTYVLDRPYNRVDFLSKKIRRVYDVQEFLDDIKKGA